MNSELWKIQQDFTKRFWDTKGGMPNPSDDKIMTAVTKDYALHIITEVTEVVQELSWRMHRASKGEIDRSNVLEELVDVSKFTLGLIQTWGFTHDQYHEEFKRKSMVVDQRFTQEQSFPALVNHPCAIIDIDGVLADYPRCFEEWCRDNHYQALTMNDMKRMLRTMPVLEKENLKRYYRQSGAKAYLPLVNGAKDLLHLIKSKSNVKIILLTNRPYTTYWRIYPDTLSWLKTNDLPYDAILWGANKGLDAVRLFKNICWAIDDDPQQVENLRAAGITTIQVHPENPDASTHAVYMKAISVSKIEDLGYSWNANCKAALL